MTRRPSPTQRFLPNRWQGPSREARWRRARASRVVAALLAALAVVLGVQAVTPDQATVAVTVAARDLPAGAALTAADLTTAQWPRGAIVPGALDHAAATGKVLTSAVATGEPLTATRVRSARGWSQSAAGAASTDTTVIPVPVASGEVAQQIHEGDRVDVFAPSGERLGTGLRVVARAIPTQAGGGLPVVFVTCSTATASAISRAIAGQNGQSGTLLVGVHVAA